uniref:KCTD8/12/16 H1 domain-containing protein n=1 Tax=Ditylenchus dipsaci TaxID=166011 RepID=A0A915DNF5_9BILA
MPRQAPKVVKLRISGGQILETFKHVLLRQPDSLFAEMAKQQSIIDCAHRDGRLVRLLVDSLRKWQESGSGVFCPPEEFDEWRQLIAEAKYWRLQQLEEIIRNASTAANSISVAYHGTLAVGKQGHAGLDINFRRIHRILISGRAWACRQVFGRSLNETRDGNMDSSRYTSRFYLTHTFLEQAFDALAAHRYKLVSSTSNNPNMTTTSGATVEQSVKEVDLQVEAVSP